MISTPATRSLPTFYLWLACLAFFSALVFHFTRDNDFPIDYHADEAGKGAQIISGELNFHHPLLLLNSASAALRLSGLPRTAENAVLCGRWVSAIFMALSVVIFTVLAWRRAGWKAALPCALLLPVHPMVFELAHYCKEDPALLLGVALSLLALDFFHEKATWPRALFLGAACGIAVSGKYLGIVMVLVAIPFVIGGVRRQPAGKGVIVLAFVGAFLGVVVALGFPFFIHPHALGTGLSYEADQIQRGGRAGRTREIPHGKYLLTFRKNVGWPLWIGLLAFLVHTIRQRPQRAMNALLLGLPLAYALMLSFSSKSSDRYFLPCSAILILVGIFGWLQILERLPAALPRRRALAGLAVFLLALFFQLRLTRASYGAFKVDSRRELAAWITENLPENSVIYVEARTRLSKDRTWPVPRPKILIKEATYLSDLGTLAELRAKGVRYVAVVKVNLVYLQSEARPVPGREEEFERRRAFYRQLLSEGKVLKRVKGSAGGVAGTDIQLLQIQE